MHVYDCRFKSHSSEQEEQYVAISGLICNGSNLQCPILLLETRFIVFLRVRTNDRLIRLWRSRVVSTQY